MTGTIVWVHGDSLRPQDPALQQFPDAPAIFVWDEQLVEQTGLSLKRILFIYECLLELPVRIYKGDVVTQLKAFAQQHGATQIVTTRSQSPGHQRICRRLASAGLTVKLLADKPFVELGPETDLKRFSRYWRAARKKLS